jgi:hypothetical protein
MLNRHRVSIDPHKSGPRGSHSRRGTSFRRPSSFVRLVLRAVGSDFAQFTGVASRVFGGVRSKAP